MQPTELCRNIMRATLSASLAHCMADINYSGGCETLQWKILLLQISPDTKHKKLMSKPVHNFRPDLTYEVYVIYEAML